VRLTEPLLSFLSSLALYLSNSKRLYFKLFKLTNCTCDSYSQEIKVFIKAYINYITKVKFFIAFQKVYIKTIIKKNIKTKFSKASLFSYNL
jgi:hypothetical protein